MRNHTKLRPFDLADEVVLLVIECAGHFPNAQTAQVSETNSLQPSAKLPE